MISLRIAQEPNFRLDTDLPEKSQQDQFPRLRVLVLAWLGWLRLDRSKVDLEWYVDREWRPISEDARRRLLDDVDEVAA